MIGLIKTPFSESTKPLDDKYLSNLFPFLLKGEKIFKSFETINFFAYFTNKRIFFIKRMRSLAELHHFVQTVQKRTPVVE